MITDEAIELLDTPEIMRLVEENMERDPNAIALDKRLPYAATIATQVKYLQRAAKKLPSYYHARAIIPPLAFEQSSSEAAAVHKSHSGELCIDLTCGLGVDAHCLSKRFKKVITVEQNAQLAHIARINFSRLGADNITVVEGRSEEFISDFAANGGKADMIYADPDRRSLEGRKLVRLEDCSPDIIALLPLLRQTSGRIVIKMSPLFDVAEIFRIFGGGTTVDVVSLNRECKEVLADWSADTERQIIRASVIGTGETEYPYPPQKHLCTSPFAPPYRYMIIPDVALRKARIASRYFADIMPEAFVSAGEGYIFSNSIPDQTETSRPIHGRVFETTYIDKFDPKALKKRLKESGIKGIEIYTHDFPTPAPELAKRLSVREGGTKVAFTRIGTELWVIGLKEVNLQ